jgi:hypothetical protein
MPTKRSKRMAERQVLYTYRPGEGNADGKSALVVMITQSAWEALQSGGHAAFDLTEAGLPLRVLIGRTKTQESGMTELREAGVITEQTKLVTRMPLDTPTRH